MLVPTGSHAGPLCLRLLNQNAVNHTLAPGAVEPGKVTSTTSRDVLPSNFQSATLFGAASPTKLNKAAPATLIGLPRRVGLDESCSRTFTVLPAVETISNPGASAGGGIGEGDVLRTVTPMSSLFAADTEFESCTMPYSSRPM